jgi:hypothetical protein
MKSVVDTPSWVEALGAIAYWRNPETGEWGKYIVKGLDNVVGSAPTKSDKVRLAGVEGVDVQARIDVVASELFPFPPFMETLRPGDRLAFKEGNPDDMYAFYRVAKIYTSTGEIFDAKTRIDIMREDGHKFPILAGELSIEHNQPGPEASLSFKV